MYLPTPTTSALLINNLIHGRAPLDAVPALRSIEKAYNVTIRLTHTGIRVRSNYGMGKTFYVMGDPDLTKTGKAEGREQCDAMRHYATGFLMWARENMPTDAVTAVAEGLAGGRQ